MDDEVLRGKLSALRAQLKSLDSLAVAFSGGVDSSLLLAVAVETLESRALAVTGVSPSLAADQLAQARRVARDLGARHRELGTAELESADYRANDRNRCFFCKHELYARMGEALGREWPLIADGTNADDLGDHRPGREAAGRAGVISPLADAQLTKSDIRALSRIYGLATAELPASPCLASRLPYGTEVTVDRLEAVERGEAALRRAGLVEFRLRHFGASARLEVADAELAALDDERSAFLRRAVVETGAFREVTIDERPLRSGRLNTEPSGS